MEHNAYNDEMQFMLQVIQDAFDQFGNINTIAHAMIEMKNPYDLVTSIDKTIEEYLIGKIRERFPSDTILSEEFHSQELFMHRTWTIDPIDGTCNMANSVPQYGIQLSFVVDGEITCAAIRTCTSELFSAQKGHGAFCNGKRIESKPRALNLSVASFGDFPHSNRENSDMTLKAVGKLKDIIMKIRFFGAACLDYAYLAAGRTDLVFMYTKNAWDLYPGILLCQEAGCTVCGMDGSPYTPSSPGVIATNNEKLLEILLND